MKETIVRIVDVDLTVSYDYSYDAGVWTYPNGDPGYPGSEDCTILKVYIGNTDVTNMVYDVADLHAAIFDRICGYEEKLRLS